MPVEALLLVSLQILRATNLSGMGNEEMGKRLLRLHGKREGLLAAVPEGVQQSAADKARWELMRYVNTVARQKTAARI